MLLLDSLSFSYEQKEVLREISLTVSRGEAVALMGPSGCGKTTLLHLIAGLAKPTNGRLERHTDHISCVFQEPRLFPWLTVKENVLSVLSGKKSEKAQNEAKVLRILEAVGLSDSASLYPSELSGGMKSRVAVARALAYEGELFLLDEPFSALDEELRQDLLLRLKAYFEKHNTTVILVTHRREDALSLGARIVELPLLEASDI